MAQPRAWLITLLLGALSPLALADTAPLDRVAIVVDNTAILESEIQQAMADASAQLAQQQQPPRTEAALRQEVTRQLILRKIQLGLIRRAGFSIDDQTLNAAVADIAKRQGAPSLMAFQQALDAQEAGRYARLRTQIREDLSIQRLRQQQVGSRIKITDQAVDNFLASPQSQLYLQDELRLTHFRVSLPENPTDADINAAQTIAATIRQALQSGQSIEQILDQYDAEQSYPVGGADMGFRKPNEIPQIFAEAIERLQTNQVTSPITAADGIHIIQLTDRRGASRTVVPQWQVRHILIAPSELVSLDDAKSRIEDLYQRLQKGEQFDTLAKTFSNDPGSARNGGDLGWVGIGEMVTVFDDMMQKTPVNDFSTPFQSQFGWHILQVLATRQQDVTAQYRRNIARQTLYQREFEQELDNWLREIRAAAYVDIKQSSK